ncbi:MAG: thiamine phosphate synthase [Erythrobacter sp.]
MGQRYKAIMPKRHPLPNIWLISDERNDAVLERSLRALPRGSAFIYRHYHLNGAVRWARFQALRRVCKSREHILILADSAQTAREWGADGIYGAPLSLYPKRAGMIQLATAHNLRELGQAARKGADAALLSPVFPTNSHPNGKTLGTAHFRCLAQHSPIPIIALGGMTQARAKALEWPRWAAIDGLS